jgi:alanine racemase
VARAALVGGAVGLAVALVDEGVELRQNDVHGPVLLLSECGADAVDAAMAYGLTPTVYTPQGIKLFSHGARMLGQRTAVHIKVDTGMHRVGAAPADVPALLQAIVDDPLLKLEGLWTHFPVADGESAEDRSFTLGQLALFDGVIDEMARANVHPDVMHAANTAGAIAFPQARYGMVRCGIGERPSYGRLRALPQRSVVATVPIGYADGVPRALFSKGASVLIGGKRHPLAGMVTMDQIVVDCEDDDSVKPGDEVVLLGRQGDQEITADEWAELLGTISYEILCGIGPRVPRVVINTPDYTGGSITPPIP